MLSSNLKPAVSCAVRYLIAAVFTFFIYLSITIVFTGFFTTVDGYTVYDNDKKEDNILYHYYYADGEDTKYAEYEAQGYNLSKAGLRSELKGTPRFVSDLIVQLCGLAISFAFIHNILWKMGDSDANLCEFGHKVPDLLRGFKIGLLATVPNLIAYIISLLSVFGVIKNSIFFIYRFINYPMCIFFNLVYGKSQFTSGGVSVGGAVIGFIFVLILPIICGVCYILGFKRVRFAENILFVKNKKGD